MKTKFKKQWTQAVAVAAAAVCAVTATCAGVTINHADAASGHIAYLRAHDNNWAIGATNDSFDNSVVMTGDGVYSLTVTNTNTYGASAWDEGEMALVLQDDWAADNSTSYTNVTINSVVFPNATYENVNYTVSSGEYPEYVNADGEKEYLYSAVFAFDVSAFTDGEVAIGESVTVNFTIGEAGEETTTTTTTTTTASSEEDVTTTTTTDTTESSEDTTTTTTVTESSNSSEDTTTTTTTESTTKATTTTTTTTKTTTTTASVTLETSIDFTQEKGDDGDGDYNAFVEFDPMGADKVRIVFKVSSSDTQATVSYGCWNNADGKWYDDENLVAIPTDKIVSYTDVVPAKVESTMKISIYYPKAAYVTIQEVVLIYDEAPVVTTTTEFESDLTFETITIGEATNKIDMLDRCYIIETIKGTPGYTISGGIYSGTSKNEYYLDEEWEEVVGDSSIIVKEYELRGQANASYGIFYYGKGTEEKTSAEVNIQTFYTGDASMNGKVNGSDVRAIVNYLAGNEKINAKEVLCDYDDDGKASLTDAVTLTKALLGSYTTQALNS